MFKFCPEAPIYYLQGEPRRTAEGMSTRTFGSRRLWRNRIGTALGTP
jgi:hypothetical protein